MPIEIRAHTRNVKYRLTDDTVLECWRLQHAGRTLAEIKAALGLDCSVMTISRAIQRAKVREALRQHTERVKARILRNLEKSPAHAQLTVEERDALAAQLAAKAMSFDQPGYHNADAATAWEPGDPETESARFKAAMDFGK
jgi:DNA-binding transcriptional MerR regulator